MANIAEYFCNMCGTLLHLDLCRRCDKEELKTLVNEPPKRKPVTKTPPKEDLKVKKTTSLIPKSPTIKAEESINGNNITTKSTITEDPYMILINANRLNICPSENVLNKLKNFHFHFNDEKLLKDIGDSTRKMKNNYSHLVKAGFLITVFKTCNNESCKFSLSKFEIPCPGHKFVKIPKWLIKEI